MLKVGQTLPETEVILGKLTIFMGSIK